MKAGNLFANLPAALPEEVFQELTTGGRFKLERILSRGQSTPPDRWYHQHEHEWVVLLRGRARLRFEGEPAELEMGPGDYLLIPAHRRHRVTWIDPDETCVWLALHFRDEA